MKKVLLYLLCIFALSSCEIDNYDGPNAVFYGSIIDSKTGELVGTDIENGSAFKVYEHGFTTPTAQTWYVKNTGEFRNNMVFAATYDMVFENGNFYPMTIPDFKINKGENTYNFLVTPYIRIKNPKIIKSEGKIVATFNLEGGKPEVELKEINLFAFSDMWVGNSVKFNLKGTDYVQKYTPSITIDNTEYTLTIDLNKNASIFKYDKNYYFRIGVLADVSNVGTIRHNYSPLEVITLDKSDFSDPEPDEDVELTPDQYTKGIVGAWTWDSSADGHFACGPDVDHANGWWNASAGEKNGDGLYDDILTFRDNGAYTFNPGAGGTLFVNFACSFHSQDNPNNGSDFQTVVSIQNSTYSIIESSGSYFIVFPPQTITSYMSSDYMYNNPKFKIIRMSTKTMYLATVENNISWRYTFKKID